MVLKPASVAWSGSWDQMLCRGSGTDVDLVDVVEAVWKGLSKKVKVL